jgi:hypothetical protein
MIDRSAVIYDHIRGWARGRSGADLTAAKSRLLHLYGSTRVQMSRGLQSVRGAIPQVKRLNLQQAKAQLNCWVQSTVVSRLWWQNPERMADLLALVLAGSIGLALAQIDIGSGDYGQWLMLSRYYIGQDIPDYRQVSSVPPMMPFMLAGTRVFIHDPMAALQVFRCGLAVAFALSFYLAGAAIFRSRGAGVLAAVCAFLVTDRLLEPFAFGGLPQLCALTFMNLGIAAFGRAGSYAGLRMRWWVLGSLGVAFAVLSHTGTGVIAVVAGVAVALASALRVTNLTWAQRRLAMMPLAAVLAALAVYWVSVILPYNQEYAQNPASLAYRGPDRIWALLQPHTPNLIMLMCAAVLLAGGCTYEASARRIGGYMVAGAWVVGSCAVLVLSVVSGAATDYPRFIPPIVAALAVAAGGGLALTSARLTDLFRERFQQGARIVIPVALAVMVALNFGPRTMAQHDQESSFYETSQLAELASAAGSLDSQLPEGAAILTTTREGKWIEGFTGREALFSIPTRYSFRTQERARSVAAETLLRSTTSLTNEFFFIKYVDRKAGIDGDVPRQPWIGANHGGEYVDLVRISPTESSVIAGDSEGGVLATLNALRAVSAQVTEGAGAIEFRTAWEGERRGGVVSYTRTLYLLSGSTVFDLVDEVSSTVPVAEVQVQIGPVPGMETAAVEVGPNRVDLYFPSTGAGEPHLRVSGVGQDVVFEQVDGGVLARAPEVSRLHLRFAVVTAGDPIFDLGLFTPGQLVETYDIQAVVLKESPALDARRARLEYLGFVEQEEPGTGSYVVFRRLSMA